MTIPSEYILHAYYGDKSIGTLALDRSTNLLMLKYSRTWQQIGFAISPALGLQNQHSPEAMYNYLDNALPEGYARMTLAQNLGISERNVYSQVRELGTDLAGAIIFTHSIALNSQEQKPNFRSLENDEFQERLDHKEDLSLLIWDDKPRLSIAGVQDKLNVFINDQGQIGFGDGSLCSTHILKFEKKNCPNLVLNEYFCMKLSSAVGLPTAEVKFRRFGEHPALEVKRFDRKYTAAQSKVMRRHVIDGCQALNLPRDNKYERNLGDGRDVQHIRDGVSLPKLFEFCSRMSSPIQSTQWLINWQLFNLMISNYDSHGKNISLYFDKNTAAFTPAYDLVNIAMFPQFKHTLAMAMGDEFAPDNIHAYQLADFAQTCSVNKRILSSLLLSLADRVIEQLSKNNLITTLQTEFDFVPEDTLYFEQLSTNILAKTKYLRNQVSQIATINV
ncbi:HipA domain-containing protein [Ningiella sp. W23]|uniref:HipA domain-containing protein n=1 Tax=Ningiella sp. W23 TaxID=3023715 RepID=UPI0037566C1F